MKKSLALFDFDGTISTKDTITEFIHYTCSKRKVILGYIILMPVFILYSLKLMSHHKAKEKMVSYFFMGWSKDKFKGHAKIYTGEIIPNLIRHKALDKIKWHLNKGHEVVVVSGSLEFLIGPWCKSLGLDLICTGLEFKDDIFTGKLASRNCYAEEKPMRIKEKYDLKNYKYIYAYGDSPGDRFMMSLAHESHYKPFK